MKIEVPYGRAPLWFDAGDRHIEVIRPVALPPPRPIDELLDEAIAAPVASPSLDELTRSAKRITVIVSDATRAEPRAAFLAAIRRQLPSAARLTVAIATGTHGPCGVAALGIPDELLRDTTIVDHDGHRDDGLVEVGTTSRGTPVRVHRSVIETDLVVATGCIRPHYFAGFGAGVKAVFPGLGQAAAIRMNHRLKLDASARAGIVVGNACRDDLEEAVGLLPTPMFLVNGVCGPDAGVHAAVAGDRIHAFRRGTELARPWFSASARPASVVVASDALPVTASLYQASKIAAAAAPFVEPGGVLAIAAECPNGVGPLETVNEAILRIGILPRLPAGASLVLVSGLEESVVRKTLVGYAASVESILSRSGTDRVIVIPRASQLICEPRS